MYTEEKQGFGLTVDGTQSFSLDLKGFCFGGGGLVWWVVCFMGVEMWRWDSGLVGLVGW